MTTAPARCFAAIAKIWEMAARRWPSRVVALSPASSNEIVKGGPACPW
jgi:hypothetical protein